MTHIGLISSNQVHCQLVQLLEVIARIGDLPRLESKPSNDLQYTLEILGFLGLWGRIVISQITMTSVVCSIAKVDKDGFGVTYVEVAIGFRRETSEYFAASCGQVLFDKVWVKLGVTTGFVEAAEEAFSEDRF